MSVQLISWAYDQETGSSTRKAVLLALANRANHDTGLCCPSVRTIMAETELGRMTVFRALTDLEKMGFIQRVERTRDNGSRTSSEYRLPSVTVVRGEYQSDTGDGVTVIPPEPEVRTGSRTTTAPPEKESKSGRPRNPVWDALAYIFGEPTTQTATKVRGKVAASITLAGGTGEEVVARAKRWPAHFPGATMTDLALEKHWHTLARKPLRRTG